MLDSLVFEHSVVLLAKLLCFCFNGRGKCVVALWQTKVIPPNSDKNAGLLAAGKDIMYHGCGDNFSAGIFGRANSRTIIELSGLCYTMVSF